MTRILVLGGGFAGLWAAIGAARKRDEIGAAANSVDILLVDSNPYHTIRVRNYEADLSDVAIPLAEVLEPVGIRHMEAEIEAVDPRLQEVRVRTAQGRQVLGYDRLILALGSRLPKPDIPGLAMHAFDVDTYDAGQRLNAHVAALAEAPAADARNTVVVVGAGFTGIEVAAEMRTKLATALPGEATRIILVDRHEVGTAIGEHARPIILEALAALGAETRSHVEVAALDATCVRLTNGETVPTQTLVWCAGMRASPLAASLPAAHDAFGRIKVDDTMRVPNVPHVFAAGDSAVSLIDGTNPTVMSCQHARPMGRFAGHNAVADLFGLPLLPLRIDWYVTVLDLGAWGALYTAGLDRRVVTSGAAAKVTKQTINHLRIYPPRNRRREDLFAAAAPVVQDPPPEVLGAAAT